MIKTGLNVDSFPSRFSLFNVDPAEVFNDLLVLVYTTEDEKVFAEHACGMIFSSFGKVSRSIKYFPLIFLSVIQRNIRVKAKTRQEDKFHESQKKIKPSEFLRARVIYFADIFL